MRTESPLLGAVDFSERPGPGHHPTHIAEDPTHSTPFPGGGWGDV